MGETKLNKRCLILGGGEIRDYAAVKAQLNGDESVLCADSGFLHCEKLNVKPDLLLGDFDSLKAIPDNVPRLDYPAEKDYTDSTLAIKTAAEYGATDLILAGMLGGRFDHSLANLQNLLWCVNHGITAMITDGETEIFAVKNGEITVCRRENAYFSVLSLSGECESVTITGAKYPLDHYPLAVDDPRAVSNEFAGGNATVTVKGGAVCIVVLPRND